MSKTKLMIVDDEVDLLAELRPLMERSGFQVFSAANGEQALEIAAKEKPDLIILDVLMPKLDGRNVLRRLRESGNWTPVILLTKVNTSTERVLSLQEGADDYLNKPFDPLELVARVQAILRRSQRGNLPLSSFRYLVSNGLSLDRQMRHVKLNGELLSLTTRAVGVVEFLMLHPHEVISRERLLDEVWGWSDALETRAVDIRIAEIRKVVEKDSSQPRFIETVIGTGYRFLADVQGQQ
ncbi:MAG: response regulator transcription factor [Anaerolineae bacterium]|nr:response regulator transcription factor [Anaerolineae bacterium]